MFTSKTYRACLIAAIALSAPLAQKASAVTLTPVALPAWSAAPGHGGWTFTDPATVSVAADAATPSYVSVTCAAPRSDTQTAARIDLPLDAVRGRVVWVAVEARVKNVSRPDHAYNGVKAMLHVVTPGKPDTWDEAAANGDSFPATYDWKRLCFKTGVPKDAASATLILGLQESTGEADFRSPSIMMGGKLYAPHPVTATGPVYTGHEPGALRGVMIDPSIGPDDIAELAKWHVNLVRWQLTWQSFPNGPANTADFPTYDKWLWSCLGHLDDMLPSFRKAGIKVLIDMHTAPGGRDSNLIYRIFTDAAYQKHFGEEWERIARRYRGNDQIWGYDLVNEPTCPNSDPTLLDWRDLAEETAKRVRAIDHDHAIIVEPDPNGVASSLRNFEPLDVSGVVYSIHFYDPGMFTGQGVFPGKPVGPVYPGPIPNDVWNPAKSTVNWDKDQVRRALQPAIDFAKNNHVHVYVGEFSAVRWAKGADKYLSDVIDVFEENHWDWSYHAFREWQGWSAEIGEDKSVTSPSPVPTARLVVLQTGFAKNGTRN